LSQTRGFLQTNPIGTSLEVGLRPSCQSPGVISLGQKNILIEEDHGNDNQFIGGYRQNALPVIFVNLKIKC